MTQLELLEAEINSQANNRLPEVLLGYLSRQEWLVTSSNWSFVTSAESAEAAIANIRREFPNISKAQEYFAMVYPGYVREERAIYFNDD